MLDFSFGELVTIGVVALVVLGPERLPKVARTFGEWLGKAQRYVSQVKADINREIELSDLKRLREEASSAVQSIASSARSVATDFKSDLMSLEAGTGAPNADPAAAGAEAAAEANPYPWAGHRIPRRYRPGPSIDEMSEELARLKRQLALPDAYAGRRRYAPRARVNRARIRR